ncbi:MAG: GH36-type glycosyl hydrolase domain-containing protein [Capsulimonadaceae bacterium]
MDQQSTILGIFQDSKSARLVLSRLRRIGFLRSTTINDRGDAPFAIGNELLYILILFLGSIAIAGFAGYAVRQVVSPHSYATPASDYVPRIVTAVIFIVEMLAAWRLVGVSGAEIRRYRKWRVGDETLLLVRSDPRQVRVVLDLLGTNMRDRPTTFAFHVAHPRTPEDDWSSVTLPAADRLSNQARTLAEGHAIGNSHGTIRSLGTRLEESETVFKAVLQRLSGAPRPEAGRDLSSEWLTDNAHLIQQHFDEYRNGLSDSFYRQLPELTEGRERGLPRVYAIARGLVAATDAHVDRAYIIDFLAAYQTVRPLTLGELWAIPLMFRLALLEHLKRLILRLDRRQDEDEKADFFANRLLAVARDDPKSVMNYVAQLTQAIPTPSPEFVEQVLGHLYDESTLVAAVRAWVENVLKEPIADILDSQQRAQTLQQVSFSSAIGSLRDLSRIDWKTVIEEVSITEMILRTDPADIYAGMDFDSRDRYRHAVERIARGSKHTEIDVAWATIEAARRREMPIDRHIGYHLVDHGLRNLERSLGYQPPLIERMRRSIAARPGAFYLGSILLLTISTVVGIIYLTSPSYRQTWFLLLIGLPAIVVASEIAVDVANGLISSLLPPRALPRLDFSTGIPEDHTTLVVIPMMLSTPESIRQDVERIGIHYIANQDTNILYALLADFLDAPERRMPQDMERLDVARSGIDALTSLHGKSRFFLLHREREWCPSENCWMGWERKRGKIEDLNRLLMNAPADGRAPVQVHGDAERLVGIRYVITLDADTELPPGTARRLVGTIAHPLNVPQLSSDGKRVLRGYTIIQPQVSTSLPSATSTLFTQLFSNTHGTDPYTHLSADLYQDLSGEATYYGKGIYNVAAFHSVLTGRFPTTHLLSHDLLESAFVRAGLASDIELFDNFPADYIAYSTRQHRWTRGDWQIADWLFARTPVANGTEANPLNSLGRWKVFDNLRRSLIPLAGILTLALGWTLGTHPLVWSLIVIVACGLPDILGLLRRFASPTNHSLEGRSHLKIAAFRGAFIAATMPHQAFVATDAMCRALYRLRVSRRDVLEWETAQDAHRHSQNRRGQFILSLLWIPISCLAAGVVCALISREALVAACPFLLLWATSPLLVLVQWTSLLTRKQSLLSDSDRLFLRCIARRTFRFFDDYVTEDSNWLPPDNHQVLLRIETAPRTSVTNIGLWLLSATAAYDLGYATSGNLLDRLEKTFDSLERLERPEGRLLNWYATDDLTPCVPRYVSTVDSGNLLGALWAFTPGVVAFGGDPLLSSRLFYGIADTTAVLRESEEQFEIHLDESLYAAVEHLCRTPAERGDVQVKHLRNLRPAVRKLVEAAEQHYVDTPDLLYWARKLDEQVDEAIQLVDRFLPWVELLETVPLDGLLSLGESAHVWRRTALAATPSLVDLSQSSVPGLAGLVGLSFQFDPLTTPAVIGDWLTKLAEAVEISRQNAAQEVDRIERLAERSRQFANSIDMCFLYDENKMVFSIGYNVEEHRRDNSYYDLLASESRLGSLIAIASGDVPPKHWASLGRPVAITFGRPALLSWSGTMFEYLMPLLLTKCFENSLLDLACRSAVSCQIDYGRQRGVPWGISESGFSALDSRRIYQYYAFGVPALALKRDIESLLVIAPYASVMALMVNPGAAIANLRRLKRGGTLRANQGQSMLGECGFYEAIDYSRRTNAAGELGVIVKSYMAHHQGMSLVALDNVLNDRIMQERFHSDPRIRAVESLLYEGVHLSEAKEIAPALIPVPHKRITAEPPIVASITTPNTITPRTALLSNSSYSVMVTNAGGGYSRWKNIDLTRWRADTTRDSYGTFCYLKDVETGTFWSSTHQPVKRETTDYAVFFALEKAEIKTRCQGIECISDIVVSPEDDVEVRHITLVNHTSRTRTVEVTSYVELSLGEHASDRAHPAFGKLFIETAYRAKTNALTAKKRPRASDESTPWMFHLLTMPPDYAIGIEYETSRPNFIGRGGDLGSPLAMRQALTGSVGPVLDPIFSIRRKVILKPGERFSLAFVLGVAETEEALTQLVTKYNDPNNGKRALDLAWTNAQIELRHRRIHSRDALQYQRLAAYVVYPSAALRPPADRLRKAVGGQAALWSMGISGDLPIVVITISDESDLDVVREVLLAHSYWRLKSLVCDLVILNDEPGGYLQPLSFHLTRLVDIHSQAVGSDRPGGVHIRTASRIGSSELAVLQATARILLVAARGSLTQQMANIPGSKGAPKPVRRLFMGQDFPSAPLPFLDLDYYNGRGGFSKDGKEYAIYLGTGETTPAPWINVIANSEFGTIVSEAGSGMTWAHNSQTNRLTPWSNDPVIDPPGDALYLRDEDIGVVWTPTASPIRERDAYRARHGCGYTVYEHSSHGIGQELTVYVPVGDEDSPTVRVQILRLRNNTDRRRRLTLTAYTEWVLGSDREETQSHIHTVFHKKLQAILAHNSFRNEGLRNTSFLAVSLAVAAYTCDRREFIGRNGSMSSPEAVFNDRLSGASGVGLDPCAALRGEIEIEPGREQTVVILLGEAQDADDAGRLIARYRDTNRAEAGLRDTQAWWDRTLTAVQVETPVRSVDILVNRWLLYQTLSCRVWARTAFYQSGGAYGFRDQLQDSMALLYARPQIAREHILRAAARQFRDGDVQHWWHADTGAGPRTRISDDLLWLPFVTAQYVRVTGDDSILDEPVPWLDAPRLADGQHEAFTTPAVSNDTDSLLDHCRRAIAKGTTSGPHGLPLIGGGDWNDGFNRVGVEGIGESVWLAWFLIHVHRDMAEILRRHGDTEEVEQHESEAIALAEVVDATAWDGNWYRRAYFDDGTPLGSVESDEAKIDSLAQTWAVISGPGNPQRAAKAMQSVEDHLICDESKSALLFTPPFDKSQHDPGYIKGYVPGVRENGGQYTHAAMWVPLAFARLGDGERAVKILELTNPIEHSRDWESAVRYAVEPYVVAADVYSLAGHEGRGGWTWYTGSSSWMYRVWLEEVLGVRVRGDDLTIAPVIRRSWPGFTIHLRHSEARYTIRVHASADRTSGNESLIVNGLAIVGNTFRLSRDDADFEVDVTL